MSTNGSKPRVTICVPTRNEEKNIVQVLGEIKERVKVPYHLLVVDGNSSDKTRELAEEHGAEEIQACWSDNERQGQEQHRRPNGDRAASSRLSAVGETVRGVELAAALRTPP